MTAEVPTPKLWVPGSQSQVKEVTSLALHLTSWDLAPVASLQVRIEFQQGTFIT